MIIIHNITFKIHREHTEIIKNGSSFHQASRVTVNVPAKYVVKHKSVKLLMTYAVGKLRGSSQYKPFNIKYKQSES